MDKPQELDIIEMPFEGLAAYWLSIKKILDTRKGRAILDEEIAGAEEPFILHVLETGFSDLDSPRIRRLTEAKKAVILEDITRKLDLMRLAVRAIASGENPSMTLVRMDGLFSRPPMPERKAMDMANAMFDAIRPKGVDLSILLTVNHKVPVDRLLVKLLFYVMYARREGVGALERFMPHLGSRFFAEGVALAMDNFESGFLDGHMTSVRDMTLVETARKMDMALEMALGVRDKLDYEDVFRIARAYMP